MFSGNRNVTTPIVKHSPGYMNKEQLVSKLRDRMLLADTHCGIVWSMMQHPAMTVVNTANALNTRTRTGAVIT